MPGYGLIASPTLYPGQTVAASFSCDVDAQVCLVVRAYGAEDRLETFSSDPVAARAGEQHLLTWTPRVEGGSPMAQVGVQVSASQPGALYLDWLTWSGAPAVTLTRPPHNGKLWQRAWVAACDNAILGRASALRICQDDANGLLVQGAREWENYVARATIRPHLARAAGLAVCVQGTQRYYALALCDDQKARLLKALDGRRVLAEADCAWQLGGGYDLSLSTRAGHLRAAVNGRTLFDVRDADAPLASGAVALLVEAGRLDCDAIHIAPI
jgi:hypothetical protein